MKRMMATVAGLLLALGGLAWAQSQYLTSNGQSSGVTMFLNNANQAVPVTAASPLPVTGGGTTAIVPAAFSALGIMSVAQASTAVVAANITSTKGTFAPASAALPTGLLRLKNAINSGGSLAVCWYGVTSGGCTASNGEVMALGESRVIALPNYAAAAALIYCLTGTCAVEVEE